MGSIPIFLTIWACSLLGKGLMKTAFVKYLLKRSFQWQNFFSKTTTLSLMRKFASKYQGQQLELNLHQLTLVFSWIKWKPVFSQHNNRSHSFDLDILMTYFLYGHMVKNNFHYFSKILTSFIQTQNLQTKHLRIVLVFRS